MQLNPLDHSAGVIALVNRIDKRFVVYTSSNISFSINDLHRKLYYKDRRLPKNLVIDYWNKQLEVVILGYEQDDTILLNLAKEYWVSKYTSDGFTNYSRVLARKYFVHLIPQKIVYEGSSRFLVYVVLAKKNLNKVGRRIIVGVFETIPEAKEWARWAYGSYDKHSVDRVVVANNVLTKRMINQPIFSDPNMIKLYEKIQRTK